MRSPRSGDTRVNGARQSACGRLRWVRRAAPWPRRPTGITTDPHGAALTGNARAGGGLDIEVSFH